MSVRFVLGRAGAGKTRYCVDAIAAALEQTDDRRRLILLVPEQASFQMERLLASRCTRRGYWRAEVLSFSRLVQRIWSELGEPAGRLSPAARPLALRALVAEHGQKLRYYRRVASTSGFYTHLSQLIEELLLAGVPWQQLKQSAAETQDARTRAKLGEIAALYQCYCESFCQNRLDPALRLANLRDRLAEVEWLAGSYIWVDGFSSFTGQELATLVSLARLAGQMTITLLLDPASPAVQRPSHPPDPLVVFYGPQRTYQTLVKMFSAAGLELLPPIVLHPAPLPRFAASPQLARLEAGLATPTVAPAAPGAAIDGQITILECASHEEELRQAAHFIRQKIGESGGRLRFRDFALITHELESFAPLVAEVLTEYEIPYFLDRRRPMRAHALSRLFQALFEAVHTDFSPRAATRLLRTGLLPLKRWQCEMLENVVIGHGVRGFCTWQAPRWDFSSDDLPGVSRLSPRLEEARLRLADALRPLVELAATDPPPTGARWAEELYATLRRLGVRRHLESWIRRCRQRRDWERAELHRLAWEAICDVLNDLHEILRDTPLSAQTAAAVLTEALSQHTLGLAPPTLDQVLVSSIERSRHPDIQYAWVFAFNEGLFPPPPPQDVLLTTQERQRLTAAGLPQLSSRQDLAWNERFLTYVALTRPSTGLVISYALVGLDGSPLLPSSFLDEVRRAVPEISPRRPDPWPPPVCAAELARQLLRARQKAPEIFETRYAPLRQLLGTDPQQAGLLEHLLRGTCYRNGPEKVGSYRPSPDAGVSWSGTPSELEMWLDCSWKHFAAKGLKLNAERRPRPHSWSLGTYAHELLAEITRRAAASPNGVRGLTDREWVELTEAVLQEFQRRLPSDLALRRPDLALLVRLLGDFLRQLVLAQAYRWRRGDFEPICCEQVFGDPAAGNTPLSGRGPWPGITLTDPQAGRLEIHGKIDRVDGCSLADRAWLLIYDYKTHLPRPLPDYLTGAWFQLLLYALAVQHALEHRKGAALAGALLAPLYPDYQVISRRRFQQASREEQQMYLYRPRGIFLREIARQLDRQLTTTPSPVARMQSRSDGDFNRTGSRDAVEPARLTQYLELAATTAAAAAAGIARGVIEPAPLVEDHRLACGRCDFAPVCRFDRTLNRLRPAETSLPSVSSQSATGNRQS